MSKEAVFKLLPTAGNHGARFTVITRGEVYSEAGDIFEPKDTLFNDSQRKAWYWKRFITTDELGRRTYFVPGDIAPSKKNYQLGWGFALAIETSLSEGTLTYSRVRPAIEPEPVIIGNPWTMGESDISIVSRVAVTSARYLDTARESDIPQVDDDTFEVAELELVKANFGPSLHAIARTILNMPVEA